MKIYKSIVIILICTTFMSFCTVDTENTRPNVLKEVSHPTEENIPLSSEVIKPQLSQSGYFGKNLDSSRLAFTVGKDGLNIDTKDLLGEIGQIRKFKDYLLVLDSKQFQLRLYDYSGNMVVIRNIGGRGPGEVGLPRGLEVVNDLIYVLDDFYKVEVYEFVNNNIEYLTTHQLDYSPTHMCHLNEYMIIMGFRYHQNNEDIAKANIIHIHDISDFKLVNSIVEPYKSNTLLTVKLLSDGPIACNTTDSSIFFTYSNFPYVFNYALNGQLIKVIDLSDYFETGSLTEGNRNGKSSMLYGPNENNYFESNYQLLFADQNYLILNTHRSTTKNGSPQRFRYIYKIDLEANTIEFDEEFLHEAMEIQITDELTVTSSAYPFPQFKVYKHD